MLSSVLSLIGNTPIIKINKIYAKLELLNPTGSIKDRMAYYILAHAEKTGQIRAGQTIVEATSGNTGISFSMLASIKGYKMVAVMPKNMSQERINMMKFFGAEVVFVGESDFEGAVAKRDELAEKMDAFVPKQFCNPVNVECHYETTGKEILQQIKKPINAFVAGTGTGGTLIGCSKRIKEKYPDCKCVAVEPLESAVMSGGKPHQHKIQGIGDGFIPEIVDMKFIDEVVTVSEKDAIAKMHEICRSYGLFVGISSGANVFAAEKVYEKLGGNIVTVLPDRGERYLSMLK